MELEWIIQNLLLIAVTIAKQGDSLRCVCRSTIDGVLVPTPGCDSNSTCTIDKQNRTLYVSGLCYKEVLVLREGGGKETVTVTQACLSLNVHGLVINTELCATNERTRERTRDVVCCGGSDYCNNHLLTGTLGKKQPSAGTPDTAATNHNSTSNQDGDWLTVEIGVGIFACFIALVLIAGLTFFVTLVYTHYHRHHNQTSSTPTTSL